MMSSAWKLIALLPLFVGCAKTYRVEFAPAQDSTRNFVLVQPTAAGGVKVWDCREMPDGREWDPTCVRFQMQNQARGTTESEVERAPTERETE